MKILAIESSCDETAAAVVEDGRKVLSSTVATSSEFHRKFGGILPELAARKQLEYIIPVLSETLKKAFPSYFNNQTIQQSHNLAFKSCIEQEIDAIAITIGPGLIGSLLVGVEAAKTIAFVTGKPIIPVNHVHAHMYANFIGSDPSTGPTLQFPAVALVVSGGHTELFLMESEKKFKWLAGTIDDAAGEAFDKSARLLGFENRGGVVIEQSAQQSNNQTVQQFNLKLPRPLLHDDTLNFSFSGLKTAIVREWKKFQPNSQLTTNNPQLVSAFAYEIQEAITDVLVAKTLRAAEQNNAHSILLAGGVAANQRLREKLVNKLSALSSQLSAHFPPIDLCTDNAVVIGSYAFFCGKQIAWEQITAVPNLSVEISNK